MLICIGCFNKSWHILSNSNNRVINENKDNNHVNCSDIVVFLYANKEESFENKLDDGYDNTIYISPEVYNLLNLDYKHTQVVIKEYYSSMYI